MALIERNIINESNIKCEAVSQWRHQWQQQSGENRENHEESEIWRNVAILSAEAIISAMA